MIAIVMILKIPGMPITKYFLDSKNIPAILLDFLLIIYKTLMSILQYLPNKEYFKKKVWILYNVGAPFTKIILWVDNHNIEHHSQCELWHRKIRQSVSQWYRRFDSVVSRIRSKTDIFVSASWIKTILQYILQIIK